MEDARCDTLVGEWGRGVGCRGRRGQRGFLCSKSFEEAAHSVCPTRQHVDRLPPNIPFCSGSRGTGE